MNQGSDINKLNSEQKLFLLRIAKASVEEFVRNGEVKDFRVTDPRLFDNQGAFVTLKANGQLRGCIGQIVPSASPLWEVVRYMAVAAASEDPRFMPVAEAELAKLEYEVSVLSRPETISDWRKIELGRHGVIVRKGGRAGVFLPQVAEETGWGLEEFLSHLCADKAGLPPDAYKNDPGVTLELFEADVICETDSHG